MRIIPRARRQVIKSQASIIAIVICTRLAMKNIGGRGRRRSRCVAGSTVGRFAARGGGAATKNQHRAAHLVGTDEARRQSGDSGCFGRADATAILAERQRQVPQAKIAELRDPRPVLCRRSSADTPLATVFPQEEIVKLDVSATM